MNDVLMSQYMAQSSSDSAFGAIGGLVSLVFVVVMYLAICFPVYKIAERCGAESPWMAFVPILNLWLMVTEMAQLDWWYIILMFIPLVNILVAVYLWMKIAENAGFPSWMAFLLLIPVVNIGVLFYMAFGPQTALTR